MKALADCEPSQLATDHVHNVVPTVERHIGAVAPFSGDLGNQKLLAHELAHIVQQRGAKSDIRRQPNSAPPFDASGDESAMRISSPSVAQVRLQRSPIRVSTVNDPLEREADTIAEQVMRTPSSNVNHNQPCEHICPGGAELDHQPTYERGTEEQALRTQVDPGNAPGPTAAASTTPGGGWGLPSQSRRVLMTEPSRTSHTPLERNRLQRSGSQPLPGSLRAFMEPRFGHDFSRVRIHTDRVATQATAALSARAFTLGQKIFFGAGQYHPETAHTKRLLAHELTHVIQQEGADQDRLAQADFAIEPTRSLPPTTLLDPVNVHTAVDGNSHLDDAQEIENLRDVFGISRQPAVIDDDFVEAVARYQFQFDLPVNGIVDNATRRQLGRETLATARRLGTIDDVTTSVIESNLSAFGLEQNDFSFPNSENFRGQRSLNPGIITQTRQTLTTAQNLIQENLRILHSRGDRFSGIRMDLPFVISLGIRESSVGTLFTDSMTEINTAGSDTHSEGRSGLDNFYLYHSAFANREQRIRSTEVSELLPRHEDRRPAWIENRRLLLAFMIKTASDELQFKEYVKEKLEDLLADRTQAASTAEQLFTDLSIDALRSWKALMFAGWRHGRTAVEEILARQHAANEAFSLEAIMTIDHVDSVSSDRLDTARSVALAALVIEGDLD